MSQSEVVYKIFELSPKGTLHVPITRPLQWDFTGYPMFNESGYKTMDAAIEAIEAIETYGLGEFVVLPVVFGLS